MLDIQEWTFWDQLLKQKKKFQDTKWLQWANTLLFYDVECYVTNSWTFFPSHSNSTLDLCCCSISSLHGSREENGKAAAQNSLIRPAVIHGVIIGQAGSCLQTWGPAERGVSGLEVNMENKKDIHYTCSRREISLIAPANFQKRSQIWGNSAQQFINTVLEFKSNRPMKVRSNYVHTSPLEHFLSRWTLIQSPNLLNKFMCITAS